MEDDAARFGTSPWPADSAIRQASSEATAAAAQRGVAKPSILLMGLRRSGKSSIRKVVFEKLSPQETMFLEATNRVVKDDISASSFIQFTIVDFPGQLTIEDGVDVDRLCANAGALVFVVDSQDHLPEALETLQVTATRALAANPSIAIEVFIHKVDGLSDDGKIEKHAEVMRVEYDLPPTAHANFYLTSIYDHSIFEAFSKVVQKLVPQIPTLESLLELLVANCRIEKAFLFDVVSKIYVATDISPVDMPTYELCSDMIDVQLDVACMYGRAPDAPPSSLAYDEQSSSLIRLNNGTVLYFREVSRYLALVCLLREDNFARHGLIAYNVRKFKHAISQVFAATAQVDGR